MRGRRFTVVIEQTVVSTKLSVDLVHVVFNDCRQLVINLAACLAMLEGDIAACGNHIDGCALGSV